MLQAVAATVLGCARRVDTVARLGGDEFAILLPETDLEGARGVLGRMRETLCAEMRRGGWPVSVSVGALTCAEAPESVEELVRRADNLMYEVKAAGKDAIRHALYDGPVAPRGGAS